MLNHSEKKYIVADPSKFGVEENEKFASFDESINIITTRTTDKTNIIDEFESWLLNSNTSTTITYA